MKLLFTIITPSFNSKATISCTLESVLNQTVQDYEYLIIDGGSTDGTVELLKEYMDKFSGKMKYWSEKDNGIYDAMNKGILKAKGKIIGIINSDDWYEKDALENVINSDTSEECLIFHGMMRTIDASNGKEIRTAIYNADYLKDAMINHPTVFVKKKVYEEFGIFDCNYKYGADYELMIRFYRSGRVKFIPIYRILANFRTGGASSSIDGLKEAMKIKYQYEMISKFQYLGAMIFLLGRKLFGYNPE